MAMIAWSAKAVRSSSCRGLNGSMLPRLSVMTPTACPSRINGTETTVRGSCSLNMPWSCSGSLDVSGTWTVASRRAARAVAEPGMSGVIGIEPT